MRNCLQKKSVAPRYRASLRLFLLGAVSVPLCALAFSGFARAAEGPQEFVVIVNPENPNSALERDFLEEAFLKKTTRWQNGESLRPVDLRPESAVRKSFSTKVLKRSVAAVRSYWQQRIFSGRDVPPPELDSDEAVVGYVLKHRGGLGYVSGTAPLGSVKVVAIK